MSKVRCASCGWEDETSPRDEAFVMLGHLASCSKKDILRYVPRWSTCDGVFECAWTVRTCNDFETRASRHLKGTHAGEVYYVGPKWYPFTEEGLAIYGLKSE